MATEDAFGPIGAPRLGLAGHRLRRLLLRHPDGWVRVLIGAALLALIGLALSSPVGASAATGHAGHHGGGNGWGALFGSTLHWQLMVTAMMLPFALESIRMTAARSLLRRRHRAIAGFLAGYLTVWGLAGLAASALTTLVAARSPGTLPLLAAAAFGAASLWQLSTAKRRALNRCHRTIPLAPRGLRADRDCVRYGWLIGGSCVASCGLLMTACALTGHNPLAMAACFGVGFVERFTWQPSQARLGTALAGLACVYAAIGLFGS